MEQIRAALVGERATLLILDNFEHLSDVAGLLVGELLVRVPQLKCLVTSRHMLHLGGEHEFPLSPLPTSGNEQSNEELLNSPSISLFVDRAQMVRPNFQVTDSNAAVLAQICDRLEGIPLAIELAAARVQLLSVFNILAQINASRLDFLVTRRRDVITRQRTLRSTLDWSYRLLPERARRMLAQVSVFRGGWTLDAAKSVCRMSEADTLELLGLLRDNSLLQVEDVEDGVRFSVLETVREYAAEQLAAMGVQEETVRLHAMYFLELAEKEEAGLRGPDEPATLRRISQEQGNFRATIEWAAAAGEVVLRARLGVALFPFWGILMGHVAELRHWLADLLDMDTDAARVAQQEMPASQYARLLYVLGRCSRILGDSEEATMLYNKSLGLLQQQGDSEQLASLLLYMGVHHMDHSLDEAQKYFDVSLQIRRRMGDEAGIARALLGLTRVIRSRVIESREDTELAKGMCREARELCRRRGDLYGLAETLVEEGSLARVQRDYSRAHEALEENLTLRRQICDKPGTGKALNYLGHCAREAGDLDKAQRYLEESIAAFEECQWGASGFAAEAILNLARTRHSQGDETNAKLLAKQSLTLYRKRRAQSGYHQCLQLMVQLSVCEKHPERTARLVGAAEALRTIYGAGITGTTKQDIEHIRAQLVAGLGEDGVAAAMQAGRDMTEERVMELALQDTA